MATTALFENMLNQKAVTAKVKKPEEDSSSKPKNLEELRQMAKKKTIKKTAKKAKAKK